MVKVVMRGPDVFMRICLKEKKAEATRKLGSRSGIE
jgi:hypothetical protein